MEDFSTPPVSGAPNLSHHAPHVLRIVLIVAIVVALASMSYLTLVMKMPIPGFIGEYLAGLNLPAELRAVTFVADRPDASTLYRHNGVLVGEKLDSSLISATVDASGSARITRGADGTFKTSLDGAVISEGTLPRVGIARSPDGKRIAYAQTFDTGTFVSPAQTPSASLDRKSWEVSVYEPATRTTIQLGQGTSPFFVDDTHVAWMAPAGLAIADLMTGQKRVLVEAIEARVPAVALVSPDRSIVAWYGAGSKDLVLYKVTAEGAIALPPVALSTPLRSLALSNDALYLVRSATLSTEIVRQPLAGGAATSVIFLPSTMRINRLLFGSI